MPESLPNKPQQPKPAAKPASPRQSGELGIDPVMAELVKTSAQSTAKACPQCKSFLPQNAALCTTCGYNLQTGKTLATRVVKEKAPKEVAAPGEPKKAYAGFEFLDAIPSWVYCAAPLLLGALPLYLGLKNDTLALTILGGVCAGLFWIAIWVWTTVAGFRNSVGWGLGCLFLIPGIAIVRMFVPMGRLITWGLVGLMIYFITNVQDDEDLKWAWGGMVLLNIALIFITIGAAADAMDDAQTAQ